MLVLLRCPFPLYMSLLLVEVEQWKSYHESRPWEIAAPPTTLNGKEVGEKLRGGEGGEGRGGEGRGGEGRGGEGRGGEGRDIRIEWGYILWSHCLPAGITEGFFHRLEAEFGAILFGHLAGYLSATKYGLTEMELLDVLSHDQQVPYHCSQLATGTLVSQYVVCPLLPLHYWHLFSIGDGGRQPEVDAQNGDCCG